MEKKELIPTIYISYAWNPESEAIAESIEKKFNQEGIQIIRDKNDLHYKGRIKDFMEQIGRGKYVILVISKKYLRSENCMFELLQIFKNQNFYERIFPVVLDEVKIAKATDRLDLLKYWENEAERLDIKIRELKELANIQGVTEDLNLYSEIRNNISGLTNILKDINTLNVDLHINSNFEQLFDLVQNRIKADFGQTSRVKTVKRAAMVLMGALVLLVTFQSINKRGLFKEKRNLRDSVSIAKIKYDSIRQSRKKDSIDVLKREKLARKKNAVPVSDVTYDVKLVVPSNMKNALVLVDGKRAKILERNLIFIKIRLKKKKDSHRFEIRNGDYNCITDQLISKNNEQLALCD